ncbi:MAG: hypothetical protein GXO75_08300 [Calditrichaeota bacterium]|nr:hypothetical protein [Calditrichota bacterium]
MAVQVSQNQIQKIFDRFSRRNRATHRAKEDFFAILRKISEQFPDRASGYCTHETFFVKFSFWSQRAGHWVYGEGKCYLRIEDGNAVVVTDRDPDWSRVLEENEIDYFNVKQAIKALDDFVGKLLNVETFEIESEKLAQIRKILES